MENDKGQWDNVVIGPWPSSKELQNSKKLKSGKTKDQIIAEEMGVVDKLSENIMVNMIHTLKDNDVDITRKDFIRDIGFINESLKSLLFRELGYEHPLSSLIEHIIVPTRTKNKNEIYTKFRADTVVELLDYLEGIEDE